ncbi:MAG: hypothetical protein EBR82_79275, partial [Caulobacteraceae bacterium]|nr:hypothetical protein [Caulobacteraceae bacterium]
DPRGRNRRLRQSGNGSQQPLGLNMGASLSFLPPLLERMRQGMQRAKAAQLSPAVATGAMPIQAPPIAQNMDAPAPQMSKRRSLLTAQAATGGRYGRLAKDLLG